MNKNEKNHESDQVGLIQLNKGGGTALPTRTKTIKVEVRTWDSLKSRKKENETFNDVIKELLMQRTKSIGNENIKAIRYKRKINFFDLEFLNKNIGFEFEYNDIKDNQSDFVLDLKIKRVFFRKRAMTPSEFFGVDNDHKHYFDIFLSMYFLLVRWVLFKEFRCELKGKEKERSTGFNNLVLWRQLYYDYNLSEESFKADIEEPLRLSEEEKPSLEWQERINNSIITKLMNESINKE